MGNERERQLHGKLLKAKEELKLEREEVCTYMYMSMYAVLKLQQLKFKG